MNSELADRQLDTLSQAVELLLQYTEAQLPHQDRQHFQLLREELLRIREARQNPAHDDLPEHLHPPFETVRPPAFEEDE